MASETSSPKAGGGKKAGKKSGGKTSRSAAGGSVAELFAAAVSFATDPQSTGSPSNDSKLKLYGLFKQATAGDVTGSQPSMFKPVERAKWASWNALKGTGKEAAMKQYVEFLASISPAFQKANAAHLKSKL